MTEEPTRAQIRRWRRYLANERAEAAVYRELASKRSGEEADILDRLAIAESRHECYWRDRLGKHVGMPRNPSLGTLLMGFLAKNFGSVFVLALMQTAEARSPYVSDHDAPETIAADERIHAEVVRGLAARGRERMSGGFRAAIFGANDGLVSNLALVIGVMGSGVAANMILITGISGLLAGALSMAAGEYISVKSQGELLEASNPHPETHRILQELDVNTNELALVYRARGLSAAEAEAKAAEAFARSTTVSLEPPSVDTRESDGAWTAAVSSFLCFGTGALIPVMPFLFGLSATAGGIAAILLVTIALFFTGGLTGVLSGKPPLWRAVRQLSIGLAATGVTWVLGLAAGQVLA